MKRLSVALIVFLMGTVDARGQELAQVEAVLLEGDLIPGVGAVTSIENLAVTSGVAGTGGQGFVEVDTDFSNTDQDSVLLAVEFNPAGSFQELFREGFGGLSGPMGALIDSFDSVTISESGSGGFNFFLSPFAIGMDSGVYLNDSLVIQEGDIVTAAGLSSGTPYIGFFDVKINDSDHLFVVASVDDPEIATTVDRALVVIDHSGQTVVAKEGDILPGQSEAVADFGTGPHESAFSESESVLFFADLTGNTATDGVVYLNQTLLAQEGSPSPIAGRNFETLSSRGNDLSANGEYVFKANLEGDTATDEVIIKNGMVFKQEGDPAPGGFVFTGFGTSSGPVEIDNFGNVLWFGEWNDPNGDINSGLFINDDLVVQEGVSAVNGVGLDTIDSGSDAFCMSTFGRHILFEGILADGTNGAFLIQLEPFVLGDVNCDGIVNLLDVQPFVALLVSGAFSFKADINQDLRVNMLDVGPFVALLSGA